MLKIFTESYDSQITNPAHKPKVLAKTFVQALKAVKAKATVTRAEATMPRDWDYGVIIGLSVTTESSETPEDVTVVLHMAAATKQGAYGADSPAEVSGMASIGKRLGKVISTQRSHDAAQAIKRLAADLVSHLSSKTEGSLILDMISLLENSSK